MRTRNDCLWIRWTLYSLLSWFFGDAFGFMREAALFPLVAIHNASEGDFAGSSRGLEDVGLVSVPMISSSGTIGESAQDVLILVGNLLEDREEYSPLRNGDWPTILLLIGLGRELTLDSDRRAKAACFGTG